MDIELRIGKTYRLWDRRTFLVHYALVRFDDTWLMVSETDKQYNDSYMSYLINDKISVVDGYLYIHQDNVFEYIRKHRVTGCQLTVHTSNINTYGEKKNKAI